MSSLFPDMPTGSPEYRTPTRKEYNAEKAKLTSQREATKALLATVEVIEARGIEWHESLYDAVTGIHNALDAIEGDLNALERDWDLRNVPAWSRWLVENNID